VYGDADEHDANAMEALISRLRRKLAIDLIETRRGHGYLIEDTGR
jgi:DNA-binding response OmpR family regulator